MSLSRDLDMSLSPVAQTWEPLSSEGGQKENCSASSPLAQLPPALTLPLNFTGHFPLPSSSSSSSSSSFSSFSSFSSSFSSSSSSAPRRLFAPLKANHSNNSLVSATSFSSFPLACDGGQTTDCDYHDVGNLTDYSAAFLEASPAADWGGNKVCTDEDKIVESCLEKPCAQLQSTRIDGFVYRVRFKRSDHFFLRSSMVAPGLMLTTLELETLVRVEGDRGEDVGRLISRESLRSFTIKSSLSTAGSPKIIHGQKMVLRAATEQERHQLAYKKGEEEKATVYIQNLVDSREMQLKITDTEFQFDMRKLTVYFEADDFVQFHALVRDVYKVYKTRIWLEQVGGSGSLTRPKDQSDELSATSGRSAEDSRVRNGSEANLGSGNSLNFVERRLNDITNTSVGGTFVGRWNMTGNSRSSKASGGGSSNNNIKSCNGAAPLPVRQIWQHGHPMLPPGIFTEHSPSHQTTAHPPSKTSGASSMSLKGAVERGRCPAPARPPFLLGQQYLNLGAGMSTAFKNLSPTESIDAATTATDTRFCSPSCTTPHSQAQETACTLQSFRAPGPSRVEAGPIRRPPTQVPSETDRIEPQQTWPRSESSIPMEFLCGITKELMIDPVTIADGHSYERSAIVAWLSRHCTSPTTKCPLPNKGVTANRSLCTAIQRYRDQRLQETITRLVLDD